MRIGVDLGGTKIEIIALDDAGAELARRRAPTPQGDYDGALAAIGVLVRSLETELGAQASVGVATPGTLSPATGLLRNSNSAALNGRPLDRDLAALLGRPVRIENDANCFALSEATDGAASGARVVFGAILGTGVGGGVTVGGALLFGRNHIAGEWGHNPLPAARDGERLGPACYCGKFGCIETFLAGPALSHDYLAAAGRSLSARRIAAAAGEGEAEARAALARYRDRLARSLAGVVNILDPDVIVLGGGVSNIDALYEGLTEAIAAHVFSDAFATPVRRARHGDSSGVRGAAWLWPS